MVMMTPRTVMMLRTTILTGMMLMVMTLMDMTRGNEEMYILSKKIMTTQR